tara:strand:- start:3047 stop:3364 length:318 start_codon:yes stop_codon:yes gene_type:complete
VVLGSSPREPTILKIMNKFESNKVWEAQTRALKMLESQLISLETATKHLQGRVKTDKLNHNYSQNSDCLAYAVKVWKSCMRLAELKKLQWELEGRDAYGKLIKEK